MPTQPRVLMVEDHSEIAELYQLKLQLDGYRVAVASNGVAGLEMAKTLHPDVILLDIHLPQLDGLRLLSALRDEDSTRELLVVVFSDDDSPAMVREAERLKAARYLVKAQLLPSRLSRTISELLRNRGASETATGGEAQRAS